MKVSFDHPLIAMPDATSLSFTSMWSYQFCSTGESRASVILLGGVLKVPDPFGPPRRGHPRHRGRRVMTGNIGLAVAVIIVLFPLALFGVLGLAEVVLVHEVAEVVIILKGIRAARVPMAVQLPATQTPDLELVPA